MGYFGIVRLNKLNADKIEKYLDGDLSNSPTDNNSTSLFIFKDDNAYYKDQLLCQRRLNTNDGLLYCIFDNLPNADKYTLRLQTQILNRATLVGYQILDRRTYRDNKPKTIK